jgi:quinoprotein glucose dehydrogenase
MTADDVWGVTQSDRDACRAMLAGLRNEGVFTPPSVKGSLAVPGNVGGMNWSGSAMDWRLGLLIVNTNNLPFKIRVIPQDEFQDAAANGEHGEYTRQAGAPFGCSGRRSFRPPVFPVTLRHGPRSRPWICPREPFAGAFPSEDCGTRFPE